MAGNGSCLLEGLGYVMSLSVCLLTRNEEKNLSRAIGSVKDVADQVIVADTGSTDRTVAVAKQLGAKVCPLAWTDDFAAGRDFALQQANADWIFWLNPDEELVPESRQPLRDCLGRADAFGFYVVVRDLVKPEQPERFSETVQLRLFRRRPELRSVGRLHPRFVPSLEETAQREGLQILPTQITLRRHGYLSQLIPAKLRWAARLLELELRDRPGQLHFLIEYGRTLLLLKDPKAHIILAKAVDQILPFQNAPTPPAPDVQRLLEYVLTVPPESSLCRLTREEARELALRWFPQSPPMLWRNAQHFFEQSEFLAAAHLLERLVQCRTTGIYDRSESFDPSILGDAVIMNLGVCYLKLCKLDRAELCFKQLLASPAFQSEAAKHLTLVRSLPPRPPGTETGNKN